MARKKTVVRSIGTAALADVLAAGCSQNIPTSPTHAPATPALRTGALTPFHTPTTLLAQPTAPAVTPTQPPTATPTPLTHVVARGEDLSGIALRYRVELAALMKANPTVNPRAMSVGTVLVIPSAGTPQPPAPGTAAALDPAQTPTPLPVSAGGVSCATAGDGGLWCFQPFENQTETTIESLRAEITITGKSGETITQAAALPLDLLPPGGRLALAAYFPAEQAARLGGVAAAHSQVLSALPNREDGRYIDCSIQQPVVRIAADGRSAEVELSVRVDQRSDSARRIWVAAMAYGKNGAVVGMRRWEKPDDEPIPTGQTAAAALRLYSSGQEITRVELMAECRPSPQIRP